MNTPFSPNLLTLIVAAGIPMAAISEDLDTRDWFKGNTHTHTLWSDGNDFPEMIIDWYVRHGYHFVALSDHDILQEGEKWIAVEEILRRQRALGPNAIAKAQSRFGEDWLRYETRDEKEGILLRTLEECREQFEVPGEFYLLKAEEISNSAKDGAPVHINALNLETLIPPIKDPEVSVEEAMRRTFIAVREQEEATGRPILAHLNHPNFRWAITPQEMAAVAEGGYVEVYNGHPAVNHLGDEERPGEEAAWDIANTIRIAEMELPPLYGFATDDSHTYHGGDVSPGRGWVHVGSPSLDGDALVLAMRRGHFYASTGVELDRIRWDADSRTLSLEIRPVEGVTHTIRFIGTRAGYDAAADTLGETKIGEVFAEIEGDRASFRMPDDAYFIRATVDSTRRHPNPSYPGQMEQAWVQPYGWK